MAWSGFSDSLATFGAAEACPHCCSNTRLVSGLCLGCLIGSALQSGERTTPNDFAAVLAAVPASDTLRRLGNYELLEEIGRGGMGVIYRAREHHSGRIVALKRILSYQAESRETVARFRREARAASALDHPNILPIYEVGETEEGVPYFSMKYAPGGSLQEVGPALRDKPREIVRLLAKVSRAVEQSHTQGILHRDLKPGNILLDARGEPLVSDFGLAKWLDTSTDLTRTLTIFGTPGYVAPEQVRHSRDQLTPAADIYSLGAILFALLSGRPPFLGDHALAVIEQAAEKPAPKLRSVAPALDRDLETICAKCLEREPQTRYQSAGDLADDLERWLEGRPITSRPVPAPVRTWRWSKRNPKLAMAMIATLVSASAAIFLLLSQRAPPPPTLPAKSIAVLPFENLSDQANVYFTQGIQDEILTSLANTAELRVISRGSVMQYQPDTNRSARVIGQALGVSYLVEGSVQRANSKIRVNAQLINARNDAHVWARTYDGNLADVFAIQSQISKAIAEALEAKLSPREKAAIERLPTIDLEAFDFYSHAKTLTLSLTYTSAHRKMLLQAADLLNQALQRDPAYFQAYCLLADIHTQTYYLGIDRSAERLKMIQSTLDAASRLQPDAGEVRLARAQYLFRIKRAYTGALRELQLVGETYPNSPKRFELIGSILRREGHLEESLQNYNHALELDPRNISTLHQVAIACYLLRRYSDVAAVLDRALTIKPDDVESQSTRAELEVSWKADPRSMRRLIDSVRERDPAKLAIIADNWFMTALNERNASEAKAALIALGEGTFGTNAMQFNRKFGEGLLARMIKDDSRARTAFMAARVEQERVIQAQPDFGPARCILGLIDAGLGNKDEALREGRRAIELQPVASDAINGGDMIDYFTIIAAWVGEKELACQYLEKTRALPGSWLLSYGQLKLNPIWDPLRGDPRFEKIVASLAPKS